MNTSLRLRVLTSVFAASAMTLAMTAGNQMLAQVTGSDAPGGNGTTVQSPAASSSPAQPPAGAADLTRETIIQAITSNGGKDVCFEPGTANWEGNPTVCSAQGWQVFSAQEYGIQPSSTNQPNQQQQGGMAPQGGMNPQSYGNGSQQSQGQQWIAPQGQQGGGWTVNTTQGGSQPYQGLQPLQQPQGGQGWQGGGMQQQWGAPQQPMTPMSPQQPMMPTGNSMQSPGYGVGPTGSAPMNYGPVMNGPSRVDQLKKEIKMAEKMITRIEKKFEKTLARSVKRFDKKISKWTKQLETTEDEDKRSDLEDRIDETKADKEEFLEEMEEEKEMMLEEAQDRLEDLQFQLEDAEEEEAEMKNDSSSN